MFDPVHGSFDVPVHYGRCRGNSKSVSGCDHIDPLLDADTAWRNDVAYFLIENLGGRPWKRPEPRRLQRTQVIPNSDSGTRGAVQNFFRRECMKMQVRKDAFHFTG